MNLTIGDITFSGGEAGYASATATVETGTFPFLLFSICNMDVSVPLAEGKSLDQYKDELLAKARERIAEIYKEIVCGGELDEEIIIHVCGMVTGEYDIKVTNKNGKLSIAEMDDEYSNTLDLLHGKIESSELGKELLKKIKNTHSNHDLEERVAALEKRLDEQGSPDMVKAIYEASKKAAEDFLNQQEKHPGEEVLVGITDNCHVSGSISSVGLPFRITDECGKLFVHDKGEISIPTHRHRDAIIDRVIHDLKQGNGNMLKLLGRCMGLLQVAAEIEAVSQMCESECERCRESILSDFDNPPFKNVPIGWISPGVKYLKRRI
ncbi:TPA: hypothetical protein ACWV7L_003320 [Salmonella enterica subsp. enterica serovar Muenchen]